MLRRAGMDRQTFRRTIVLAGLACCVLACGCGGSLVTGAEPPRGTDGGALDAEVDTGAVVPTTDAGSVVPPKDAGAFACGDALCEPSQICLTPAWGCIAFSVPPNDAGACPDGTEFSGAAGACAQV